MGEQAERSASGRVESPALASIRLASGETAYVELSPAGRRRLDEIRKGTVIEFDNADVVERHRHPRGIRWMSLNRLMRLRDEETAEQQTQPGSGVVRRELHGGQLRRRLLEPLNMVPVVSRRKVMVAFVLDMNDQPWSWEESEEELEERLRTYNEALYQQHMRDVKRTEAGDRGKIRR